jgi:hypothetical protein
VKQCCRDATLLKSRLFPRTGGFFLGYNIFMNKGFGIIGLVLTIAIICVLVYGAFYLTGDDSKQNQLEQGQNAVDSAKDAAGQENDYNAVLQGGEDVNYRGAQQKAQSDLLK